MKKARITKALTQLGGLLLLGLSLAGCSQSYPADRVKESIQEICRKEYGIDHIQVQIEGKTIGVYLPVKKLFARDFKEALLKGDGKLPDVENLFQPSPEALDQVEDVLFSISRVLLSTDLKLEFYTLQATDLETTGLELVLTGYADDIKRVRLWDISRDEYRRRVFHELRLNRAVIWHRVIRSFFADLEKDPSPRSTEPYFAAPLSPEIFYATFFANPERAEKNSIRWQLGELRSAPLGPSRIVSYVPVRVEYDPKAVLPGTFLVPSGTLLEYFFITSFATEQPQILQVIPLTLINESGKVEKVSIPEEFDLEKDLELWETEFSITEIKVGDFLAEQLTRRAQALILADERIQNTFDSIQLAFGYHQEAKENYFSLQLDLKPRSPTPLALAPSIFHEDVLYLLNLASREFVEVLRSYQFSDYQFLQLKLASDPTARVLGREDLELFRRNKATLQGLLGGVSPL